MPRIVIWLQEFLDPFDSVRGQGLCQFCEENMYLLAISRANQAPVRPTYLCRSRRNRTDSVGHSKRHVTVDHDWKVWPNSSSPLLVRFNIFLQSDLTVCRAVGQLYTQHSIRYSPPDKHLCQAQTHTGSQPYAEGSDSTTDRIFCPDEAEFLGEVRPCGRAVHRNRFFCSTTEQRVDGLTTELSKQIPQR
eukprot:COSAG02_NODE_926_length_15856_cov_13.975566_8_plen_190_part_00